MQQVLLFFKSRYFLLIGFISLAAIVNGSPIDSITGKTVAANFYAQNYVVKISAISLVYAERSSQGEAEYYVYNINPDSGFVIVSADDAAHPIIGYSSEGHYNTTHISPDFSFWMQHYKKQIDLIRLNNIQASVDIQNEWDAYKNNLSLKGPQKITGSVSQLVQTIWAQSPYYNATCPGGAVAGCVATAMAQIMKYWEYPPHGIDSNTYTDNPYGTLFADFDTTYYNWAAMPLKDTSTNLPVATLSYDCGVSVNMSYSASASNSYVISGDYPICAQTAFVRYFGYSSAISGLYRNAYIDATWISLLENELTNGRPILYVGYGNQGGHAWVCDGYNGATGDFHMNWGWGGYENGYYNLNSLNPANIPLSNGEEALIGIQPATAIADFKASPLIVWAGDTVKFTDRSFGKTPIIAWQWSLNGANTTTINSQNPAIVYGTPGTYDVSETVTSSQGASTLTHDNYILVLANNPVNVYPTLNDGTFTVQLHDASLANSNLQFALYNMLGQKVYTTALTQYTTQVTVVVPHGMYFFRAFDASKKPVSTGKLVMK